MNVAANAKARRNATKAERAKPNTARSYRQQAACRASYIAALGWEPEDGTAEGRYCATTGELLLTLREKFGLEIGNKIAEECEVASWSVR